MTDPADASRFETAADLAAPSLGAAGLRAIASRLAQGWPDQAVLGAVRDRDTVAPVLAAATQEGVTPAEAAAFLRGLAAGHARASEAVTVETVWTGPSTHAVPVRATAQVLVELIEGVLGDRPLGPLVAAPDQYAAQNWRTNNQLFHT